jgi:hypothetical protein
MLVYRQRSFLDSHLPTDTNRLMNGIDEFLSAEMGNSLSVEFVSEAGVIPQASE